MKIIGSVLIIFSSVTVSFYYEKHLKEQIKSLKAILDFVEYIKNQIQFFSLPLNDIYARYGSDNPYINKLKRGETVEGLDTETQDELYNCFSALGRGFKDEQIQRLEYTNFKIKAKIETFEKEYSQKNKVFRAIAIFIGCCTVILLV